MVTATLSMETVTAMIMSLVKNVIDANFNTLDFQTAKVKAKSFLQPISMLLKTLEQNVDVLRLEP